MGLLLSRGSYAFYSEIFVLLLLYCNLRDIQRSSSSEEPQKIEGALPTEASSDVISYTAAPCICYVKEYRQSNTIGRGGTPPHRGLAPGV